MSVKEFWEDDPELFWAYRFSYLEKVRRNKQEYNERAWLQGAYFYDAISASLSNAFGNKSTYLKEPFNLEGNNQRQKPPKQSVLDEQLKARAIKVKELLGGDNKECKTN